jgi:hypothetical protein
MTIEYHIKELQGGGDALRPLGLQFGHLWPLLSNFLPWSSSELLRNRTWAFRAFGRELQLAHKRSHPTCTKAFHTGI